MTNKNASKTLKKNPSQDMLTKQIFYSILNSCAEVFRRQTNRKRKKKSDSLWARPLENCHISMFYEYFGNKHPVSNYIRLWPGKVHLQLE